MSDLSDKIEQTAEGPKKVTIEGGTNVENHSIRELIDADRYLKNKQAARGNRRGLRINKLRAPGSV